MHIYIYIYTHIYTHTYTYTYTYTYIYMHIYTCTCAGRGLRNLPAQCGTVPVAQGQEVPRTRRCPYFIYNTICMIILYI